MDDEPQPHPQGRRGLSVALPIVSSYLDTVEDYTAAPLDCGNSSGKAPLFNLRVTNFNCTLGYIDGVSPTAAQVAPPPALRDDADSRARRRRSRGNDHPRSLPCCRDDEDEDQQGRRSPRHGSHDRGSGGNLLAFRRERIRSPRRRDGNDGRHGHHRDSGAPSARRGADAGLQELFDAPAKEIQVGLASHANLSPDLQAGRAEELRELLDRARSYLSRATAAAALLGLAPAPAASPAAWAAPSTSTPRVPPANEAWFDSPLRTAEAPRADASGLPVAFAGLEIAAVPLPATPGTASAATTPTSPGAASLLPMLGAPSLVLSTVEAATATTVSAANVEPSPTASCAVVLQDPGIQRNAAAVAGEVPDDCTLANFFTAIGKPRQPAILPLPTLTSKRAPPPAPPRRSGRVVAKKKGDVSCSAAVQELLARVCGLLDPGAAFDDKSRDAFISMFKTPLSAPVIKAIETLVKQVKKMKTKSATAKGKAAAPKCSTATDD
ncbi:uncharacterized protein LOC106866306 [Brachypodium distachyon]|uniref:uncharacterized protein LOC106866306 n=1 Tax=Brachypodium distachyon TaxID=15368 RepID=UPI00071D895B|nr:uncharacterized protein LOC106866306 [Brachypodium distachyon]|eukprot:XP_014755578.1 uncharacterized protein LOC106866306 [Brachypodium distachyon]